MDALRREWRPLTELLEQTRRLLDATGVSVLDTSREVLRSVGPNPGQDSQVLEAPVGTHGKTLRAHRSAESPWPAHASASLNAAAAFLPILGDVQDPEEELEAFRALVDASPVVAWVKDREGRLTFASHAFERLHGAGPGGLVGRTERDLAAPELAAAVRQSDLEVMELGRPLHVERVVPGPNGEPRIWLTHKFPLQGGRALGGVAVDVTAVRHQAAELASIERRFESLTREAPVGIFETNLEGECSFVNRQFTELAGLSAEDCRGRGWKRAVHYDDLPALQASLAEARRRRSAMSRRFRLRHDDGTVNWVDATVAPLPGPDGSPVGFIGTLVDVTIEHLATSDLREAELGFRSLVESIPVPMLVIRSGTVVFANRGATALFRLRAPVELVGRRLAEVCPAGSELDRQLAAIDSSTGAQFPLLCRCANGDPLNLMATATRIEFDGAPSLALMLVNDANA